MNRRYFLRRSRTLAILVALAAAYLAAIATRGTLTGSTLADGHLGVMLGLFICAFPSAHAVDLLFYNRQTLYELTSEWFGALWLLVNLFVLFTGWCVVVRGIEFVTAR